MYIPKVEDEANAIIGLVKIQRLKRHYVNGRYPSIKTDFQKSVLLKVFEICAFPSVKNRRDLAILLGVPFDAVNVWYKQIRSLENIRDVELKRISPLQILNIYLTEAAKLK